jgi:hypothetical protein
VRGESESERQEKKEINGEIKPVRPVFESHPGEQSDWPNTGQTPVKPARRGLFGRYVYESPPGVCDASGRRRSRRGITDVVTHHQYGGLSLIWPAITNVVIHL